MYSKIFTLDDIRALGPCIDPTEYEGVEEGWTGTAQDILSAEQVKPDDRLWVVLRLDIPRRIKLEFAWWVANQARHLMLDKRSTRALDALRSYLDGNATADELRQARVAAKAAAWAALDAARTVDAPEWAAAWASVGVEKAAWASEAAAARLSEVAAWAALNAAQASIWAVSEQVAQASQEAMRRPQILHLHTLLNAYTAEQAD